MDPMPPDSPYAAPPPLPSSAYPVSPGSSGFAPREIFQQTFSVYGANFVAFTILSALVCLPPFLCVVLLKAKLIVLWLGVTLLDCFIRQLGTAAIASGAFGHLRGRPKTVGEVLSAGVRNLFSALGVSLLAGLCVAGGLLLFVIPGIYIAVVLAVAVPVAVQEKLGGMEALRRSANLTQGHRGDIFAVLFLIGLTGFVVSVGLDALFKIGGRSLHPELLRLLAQIPTLLVVALIGTAASVMYCRLCDVGASLGSPDITPAVD